MCAGVCVYVCVCVHVCVIADLSWTEQGGVDDSTARQRVCSPDLSWVVDWDSDGYVCACVKFVTGLSNTAGMRGRTAVMDCACACVGASKC